VALVDPTKLLARNDKWYVGGGSLLIYAPPFPMWDEVPGYWDTVHFGNLPIKHLLAVTILMDGRVLALRLRNKSWFPDRSEYEFEAENGILLKMVRKPAPPDGLICEITLKPATRSAHTLDILFWGVRKTRGSPSESVAKDFRYDDRRLTFTEEIAERSPRKISVAVAISLEKAPTSFQVTPAHFSPILPLFELTPFYSQIKMRGRLANRSCSVNFIGSLIYYALHKKVKLESKEQRLACHIKASELKTSKLKKEGFAKDQDRSEMFPQSWQDFLRLIPHFECSDEFLTRYYWYRWYGIWLNTIPGGTSRNYPYPAVTEGIDYFRGVITYSLMCHVREAKWLKSPLIAQGCVLTHIKHQASAGHFAGHIYLSHVQDKVFYFTDWGGALEELINHHPDERFERQIYRPLKKYLQYFLRERDRETSHLFDVWDQFETGQEYSSRYLFADKHFDRYGWESRLRMKGVDATYYIWKLASFLARLARKLGKNDESRTFQALAEKIKSQVREKMWDDREKFFFDFDAKANKRSPYFSAVGFYPVGSEIATREMALCALKHLFNKAKFCTAFPTPTSPVDDPCFSADANWRGERANCPWNGRVWPMVNSHISEVLAYSASLDKRYRKKLADYVRAFVKMMFFERDPKRPNCFEHYSPFTGEPCLYRGIDDYQHSWVADLILKYAVGLRATPDKLIIDPFPFGLDFFILKDALIRGNTISVLWNRTLDAKPAEGFFVLVNRKTVFHSKKLTSWELEI